MIKSTNTRRNGARVTMILPNERSFALESWLKHEVIKRNNCLIEYRYPCTVHNGQIKDRNWLNDILVKAEKQVLFQNQKMSIQKCFRRNCKPLCRMQLYALFPKYSTPKNLNDDYNSSSKKGKNKVSLICMNFFVIVRMWFTLS